MIPANTPYRTDYDADGSLAIYAYTFPIQVEAQLAVYVLSPAGVQTKLVLNTDFMVDGDGEPTGGTVEFVNNGQEWVDPATGFVLTGWKIAILMAPGLKQETDISNQGPFFEEVVEKSMDRLTMADLEQQGEIDASIKTPKVESPEDFNMVLPTAPNRANKVIGFDSEGKLAMLGITGLDADVSSAELGDKLEYDGTKWINSAPIYRSGALDSGGGAYDGFMSVYFGGIKISLPSAGTYRIWGTFATEPDVESWFAHAFCKSDGQGDHSAPDSITTGTGVHLKAGGLNSETIQKIPDKLKQQPIAERIISVPGAIDVYIVPFGKAVGDGAGNLSVSGHAYAQRISLSTT